MCVKGLHNYRSRPPRFEGKIICNLDFCTCPKYQSSLKVELKTFSDLQELKKTNLLLTLSWTAIGVHAPTKQEDTGK